jgi:pilus assembly protein CpaB
VGERRNILVIVAVVLVVAAVVAVVLYVSGADDRAANKIERVDALVATRAIPRGTTGQAAFDQGLIGFRQRTQESIPANIVKDPKSLKDLVAVADYSENQFITTDTFVGKSEAATGGALVTQIKQEGENDPSGRQAVSFSFSAEQSVNSEIVPGDTVMIIATRSEGAEGTAGYIVEKAPVIGQSVEATTDSSGNTQAAAPSGNLILSLDADQILRLVAAKKGNFELILTLVPRNYNTPLPSPFVSNPLPGGQPVFQ